MIATEIPITETYLEVKMLIHRICRGFVVKNGGDLEELVAESNIVYIKAYRTYQLNSKCKWTSYLAICVYNKLLDIHNKERRHKKLWSKSLDSKIVNHRKETYADIVVDRPRERFGIEFLAELSEDAKSVLKLVLDSPEEILESVELRGEQWPDWKIVIKQHLKDVGWVAFRISKSFREIKEAL